MDASANVTIIVWTSTLILRDTQKKVDSEEEENAPAKFLSQFPVNLRASREKRFCHTNKIICQNIDNKNILLQQQNV